MVRKNKIKELSIKGNLWLEKANGLQIGKGRTLLLEKINECGSISRAAKILNISYRKAWAMVKNMNSDAGVMLVEKIAGGANGGGAKLTLEGKKIINEFNKMSNAFIKFQNDFPELMISKNRNDE